MSGTDPHHSLRLKVIVISVFLGLVILVLKWWAFFITGSSALQSDAFESIVNVLAALFALGSIVFASQPADQDHPYGHGKIEYFSSAFEGGLVAVAAVWIMYEAVLKLLQGSPIQSLDSGMLLNLGAGILNGGLGLYLIHSGKKTQSRAIEADGHHVLSDFYTSIAILAGLLIVKWTGVLWLDRILSIAVGLFLLRVGYGLVKESAAALLDAEDPEMLEKLLKAINAEKENRVITIHELRAIRSGRFKHVDIHVVVPEYMSVSEAHEFVEDYGERIIRAVGIEGEFHTHIDPCRRIWCKHCLVSDCPIRKTAFVENRPLSLKEAIGPERFS